MLLKESKTATVSIRCGAIKIDTFLKIVSYQIIKYIKHKNESSCHKLNVEAQRHFLQYFERYLFSIAVKV